MGTASTLQLPPDAADLIHAAKRLYPGLKNFAHATGHVRAQNDLGQWVHIQHTKLRKLVKDFAAAADFAVDEPSPDAS
jgi:hypothetical protein